MTTDNLISDREKLMKRMKITRSNRFNCAKRLENKAFWKSGTISVLSLLSLVAGVYALSNAGGMSASTTQVYGTFLIGVSIVSIIVSLQQPVSEISKRATDAHRCGREISHVYRRLEAHQIDLSDASKEYEDVVSRYEDNHDRCDYLRTVWEYRDEMANQAKDANWFNGVVRSWLSEISPAVAGCLGLVCVGVIITAISWLSSL